MDFVSVGWGLWWGSYHGVYVFGLIGFSLGYGLAGLVGLC